MKRNIIILCLFFINCMVAFSQENNSCTHSNERIVTSKKTEYLNIEKGWESDKNQWYYYGNQTVISPVFYTILATIDSTYIFNGKEKKIRIKVHTVSSGSYQTSENGWSWNKDGWSFEGKTVHSYPPSFTKKAKIIREEADVANRKRIKIEEIEELYRIENEKWSWNAKRKTWLDDKGYTDKMPEYKIVKSTIHSYNESL